MYRIFYHEILGESTYDIRISGNDITFENYVKSGHLMADAKPVVRPRIRTSLAQQGPATDPVTWDPSPRER